MPGIKPGMAHNGRVGAVETPPTIGEMWMALYLLAKGVRSPLISDRAPIAAEAGSEGGW
jgi:hypothetical protein